MQPSQPANEPAYWPVSFFRVSMLRAAISLRSWAIGPPWAPLLALALALGGCGAFRTQATALGTDVIGSIREQEPEVFEIQRQLADSFGSFIGRAVEDKVLSRASGVWDTMLLKMNDQSKAVVGRLAEGVERDLNRSLQVMLSENLDLTSRKSEELVNTLLTIAAAKAGPLVDSLRPQVIKLISEAGESLSSRLVVVDRTLAESKTGKGVVRTLWGFVIGLGVIVIGGGLAWRRNDIRNRQAFRAATAALQPTAPFQRDAVQQVLRNQGFDRQADWLK